MVHGPCMTELGGGANLVFMHGLGFSLAQVWSWAVQGAAAWVWAGSKGLG